MADAAALIQAVTEMEERAKAVPGTAKRMADLAGDYQKDVAAYLERVGQKKERVEALKSKVDGALKDLQEKAATERPVLEGGMKEIETAVEQSTAALNESLGELETALDATRTAVSRLQAGLSDAGQRAEAAHSAAGSDLDGLRGQMTSSESGLDTFVGTAMNTTDGAEQAAGEARDTVVAGLDALAQRMLEYAEQHVGTRLDRAAAAVEGMFEEHGQQVQEMLSALDSGARDIAKEVVEDIEEQVTERVSALVEHAAGTYLGLEQAHDQAAESSGNEREEAGERAGELFGCIAPMEQMVDEVRKAAARVNTQFPG